MANESDPRKGKLVAFKAEQDLAEFLDKLENRSEFIRQAILAQFGATCNLCDGSGVVPRGVGEHFQAVIDRHRAVTCRLCGEASEIPAAVPRSDTTRWEQFLHGGEYYCVPCFEKAPPCESCGWHVDAAHALAHQQRHSRKPGLRKRSAKRKR